MAKETVQGVQRDLLPVVIWKMEKEGALGCLESADMLKDAVIDLSTVVRELTGEEILSGKISLAEELERLSSGFDGWLAVTIAPPHVLMKRDSSLSELSKWIDMMDEPAKKGIVIFRS